MNSANAAAAPLTTARPVISWAETRRRMAMDRQRLAAALAALPGHKPWILFLHPSALCVWLHRLAHHCHTRRRFLLSRFLWHLDLLLTGADISPMSDIGGGVLISHPVGIGLVGRFGERCTFHAQAGAGGGSGSALDIGAGPGLPVLGDEVVLEPGALIMGPIRIGNRVRIGARCLISRPVADEQVVEAVEPRALVQEDPTRA